MNYFLLDIQNKWQDLKWKRLCRRKLPDLLLNYLRVADQNITPVSDLYEAFEGVSEARICFALKQLVAEKRVIKSLGGYKIEE